VDSDLAKISPGAGAAIPAADGEALFPVTCGFPANPAGRNGEAGLSLVAA